MPRRLARWCFVLMCVLLLAAGCTVQRQTRAVIPPSYSYVQDHDVSIVPESLVAEAR